MEPAGSTGKKRLLLFIHGLGGSADASWGRFPDLVRGDPALAQHFDVALYAYPTSLFVLPFLTRPAKIQDLAAGLRNQINNRFAAYDRFVLVAHSMGGLIARKYLIDEAKGKRPLRVTKLALFAVPHIGAKLAAVASHISWRHNQIKQLCRESDFIELLNEDWFALELGDKLDMLFLRGTQDEVVERVSAMAYWGNPDFEAITGRNHVDIVKPLSADDDAFITLKRFLLRTRAERHGPVPDPYPAPVIRDARISTLATELPLASPTIVTPPPRFIGREGDASDVGSALLSREGPILVLGGPGMGKSTLTREVATRPEVIARYGARRWFVELETAASAEALETAIVVATGFDPATTRFDVALARLGGVPGLLVLDNLETPWEVDRAGVEQRLAALAAVSDLALLASIRGAEAPAGIRWTLQKTLVPLAPADASALFRDIAGRIAPDDPNLAPLLDQLGGVPLVIELVAHQAEVFDTLEGVRRQWQSTGTELAQRRGVPPSRPTSLEKSLELSFTSPRLGEAGRRLFRILGELPAGIAPEDRETLLKTDAFVAERDLLATGLAMQRSGRLDLLAPVRDHAKRIHLPEGNDVDAWRGHYLGLTRDLGGRIGTKEGIGAIARLAPELPNLEAAIEGAMAAGKLDEACTSAVGLSALQRFAGLGTGALFRRLASACRSAGATLNEATCHELIGNIALDRSDHDAARTAYEQALALYHQVGAVLGEANCIKGLGDIAFERSNLDAASRAYELALPLYRQIGATLGEANCIKGLGDIALERSSLDAALKAYEEALPLHRKVGDVLGEANCIRGVGDVALRRSDHASARKAYNQALPLYHKIGALLGEANCIFFLGDIALSESDRESARKAYEQTLPLYRQIGDILGEANCMTRLGDIVRDRLRPDEANERYQEALALYQRIPDAYGIGMTHARLASLATGDARAHHLAAARRAWTSIDRFALAAGLPKE